MYSFGMILYELFTGGEPFQDVHSFALPSEVQKGNRPPLNKADVPKPISRLIKACWNGNAGRRPTISKVLAILQDLQRATQEHP